MLALADQPGRSPRPGCAVKNFILSGAGVATRMTAGAGARLVIVFPPQHIGEERSRRNSGPSDQLPLGGVVVPAWRGVLSAPRRLEIDFPAGTQVPITIEGLLAAYVATGRGRQGGAQRRINTILKLTLPATPGQNSAFGCEKPMTAAVTPTDLRRRSVFVDTIVLPHELATNVTHRTRQLNARALLQEGSRPWPRFSSPPRFL